MLKVGWRGGGWRRGGGSIGEGDGRGAGSIAKCVAIEHIRTRVE